MAGLPASVCEWFPLTLASWTIAALRLPVRRRAQVAVRFRGGREHPEAIVVMDSNDVPGTEAFACFSTSASAYKTSLSPARTRFASTFASPSQVGVTLGL